MIELRTLGAVDLKDSEGRDLRPLLAQPKRVALLTYLALANPSRFRRRDTVVALFWPGLDAEHARGSLRQSLRFLRRALGDGVVVTRGEEEIGIDRAALTCDTTTFADASDAGRHAEAMELYGGDFLDGFFVSDAAPEFENWIDEERTALRRRAVASAWALATAARRSGDRARAKALARRAAGFAPDDEGEVCRLIRFLDELGDRSGALSAYGDFARRLHDEFDASPAPETNALIQHVRDRSAPSSVEFPPTSSERVDTAAGAAAPSVAPLVQRTPRRVLVYLSMAGILALAGYVASFAGNRRGVFSTRPIVAVLPMEYRGDTSQSMIADRVTDDLITDLGQSGSLQVIGSRTMMQYRGSSKSPRDIGRALNADVLLYGRVQRMGGDTVHMTVQLFRSGSDRALWTQSLDGPYGQLLRMQSEIARAVTRQLRIAPTPGLAVSPEYARPLDSEALNLYQKGRYSWNVRGPGLRKSIDLFRQALDVDPNFALAYSGLADAYVQLGYGSLLAPGDAFPKAEAAARKALDLDSTLAEPHATLGYVSLYYRWDWQTAEEEFKRALALNPSYSTGHEWYGLFLTAMGRFDQALAEEHRAQELDPLAAPVTGTLGWVLHYAGRQDDAARELNVALRMLPTFDLAHLYLGRVYQAKGQLDSALSQYAATGALRNWVPTVAAEGYVYGLQENHGEARKVLERLDSLGSTGQYVTAYAWALVHAALGQRDSALVWLERGVRERTHWLVWLNRDRRWESLRNDPRFAAVVRAVGLPP